MPNFRAPALLSLAAVSLVLAAPLAPAFAQAPPPMMHSPQSGQMVNPLGITSAQRVRMQPIIMNANQQMRAIQALPPSARMAKMQALQKSVGLQMMAILTPTQRAKAHAMMQARTQAMMQSHAPGSLGGFNGAHH